MNDIATIMAPVLASQKRQRENLVKIFVTRDLGFDETKKSTVQHFVNYVDRALCLERDYEVYLVSDKRKYGIETTAAFINEKIMIFCKGRMLIDIMRSIAHEMVHAKHEEEGKMTSHDFLHFDNPSEDEANELAGEIVNAYTEVMGRQIYDL